MSYITLLHLKRQVDKQVLIGSCQSVFTKHISLNKDTRLLALTRNTCNKCNMLVKNMTLYYMYCQGYITKAIMTLHN